MWKRTICLIVALWAVSSLLYAQDAQRIRRAAVLHLYYIEGNGVILTIAGEGQTYSARDFPDQGIALAPGDIVMTGRGCVAELQVLSEPAESAEHPETSAPIIKLVENTTLRYLSSADSSTDKMVTVEILYGRTRMVVPGPSDLAAGEKGIGLTVRTGNMQADVSGGDFDVDYMIHPGGSLIERGRNGAMRTQVYSFRGKTEIIQTGNNAGVGFIVDEYERVAIEVGNARSVIERRPLDLEIISFWEAFSFVGAPPIRAPGTALPPRGSHLVINEDGQERYMVFPVIDNESAALANIRRRNSSGGGEPLPLLPSLSDERKKLKVKNGFLIGGTILSGLGLGAILYQNYGADLGLPQADIIAEHNYIPYIPLGAGILSLIISCFINPVIP
jgi:hypothetical protein